MTENWLTGAVISPASAAVDASLVRSIMIEREAVDVGLHATEPRQQPEPGHRARFFTGGGVHVPSRMEGGVSFGQ